MAELRTVAALYVDPRGPYPAVEQVRACGGVLEHPAGSELWGRFQLPRPGELVDEHGGFTLDVDQVRWGHVARKRTWLYCVGVRDIGAIPPDRAPTHWISGFRSTTRPKRYDRNGSAVPPGIKVCSAQQRRRTPPDFARWLVSLARTVQLQPQETEARRVG